MSAWNSTEPCDNPPKSFEDDFITVSSTDTAPETASSSADKLPDSAEYLNKLERKLKRLQTNTNVLEQLKSRREHCIEALLASDGPLEQRISDLELDQPANQQQLLRLINPQQPLTVGEILHLVQHDELENKEEEEVEENQQESKVEESPEVKNSPTPSR